MPRQPVGLPCPKHACLCQQPSPGPPRSCSFENGSSSSARFGRMQWLVILVSAIAVLVVLSFLLSALKWLLVVAVILVVAGLLTGVIPRR